MISYWRGIVDSKLNEAREILQKIGMPEHMIHFNGDKFLGPR